MIRVRGFLNVIEKNLNEFFLILLLPFVFFVLCSIENRKIFGGIELVP